MQVKVLGNDSASLLFLPSVLLASIHARVDMVNFSATHGYTITTVVTVWKFIIETDTFIYNEFFPTPFIYKLDTSWVVAFPAGF